MSKPDSQNPSSVKTKGRGGLFFIALGICALVVLGEVIKKRYEAGPLDCPCCEGATRIMAFIDLPDLIE